MENFSTPSDWDKSSKAIQNPIELKRNGPEGKMVFYLETTAGQKMTADFKLCLKPHRFFHEKQEGCHGGAVRTARQLTSEGETLKTVKAGSNLALCRQPG